MDKENIRFNNIDMIQPRNQHNHAILISECSISSWVQDDYLKQLNDMTPLSQWITLKYTQVAVYVKANATEKLCSSCEKNVV